MPKAIQALRELLQSPHPHDYLSALGALAPMPHPDLMPLVRPMLANENLRARALALAIWSRCRLTEEREAIGIIDRALGDPAHAVRAAALEAAARLPFAGMPLLDWLSRAMKDIDYRVRAAGRACAKAFVPTTPEAWTEALSFRLSDFELQELLVSELSATELEEKPAMLRRALSLHLKRAREKLLILENFSAPGEDGAPALQLLKKVLREESRRHLTLVLHILGCLDQSRQMCLIRAGLASQNRQLWAQAMESALQFRKEGAVFRELAVLFEAEREGAPLKGEPPGGKRALDAWLDWCQKHGSEWLAECARHCVGNPGFAT